MSAYKEGDTINSRYVLKKYVGRGTYGEVWRAYDKVLKLDVAIKLYVSLDNRGRDEFVKEYRTAYGLHHPNLLTATYYDVWDNRPYLVMEFCEKGASDKLVGKITESDLWRFIRDVSSGLAYLHSLEPEPIIHQDIKPENVLINNSNNFVISDFGISLNMRSTMMKQSGRISNSTGGAIAYMGPERFSAEPTPIKASDIWSLGASIYEMATGELPFCGLGGSMLKNGAEMPSLPADRWSTPLNRLVRACMAKNTWDRPTAQQIKDYANAHVEGIAVPDPAWLKDIVDVDIDGGDNDEGDNNVGRNSGDIIAPLVDNGGSHDSRDNGVVHPPEPKKKWWLIITLPVAAALAYFIVTGPNRALLKEAKEYYPVYLDYYDSCYEQVAKGDYGENLDVLLKAKENYAILLHYEEVYSSVSTGYNLSSEIKDSLDKKLDDACNEWLAAARRQLEIDDIEGAVSFYLKALEIKDTPDKHIPSLDYYVPIYGNSNSKG